MEAYKSSCPDCKSTYFWQGFKTGFGKTPEQLKKMEDDHSICKHCGSHNLNTTLDYESDVGQAYQESTKFLVQEFTKIIGERSSK